MGFVLIILVFCATALVIWRVPIWQAGRLSKIDPRDRFNVENEARKTITQIVGGLFFLGTLYFTWKSADMSREQLDMSRDAQMSQRFASATEHLGSKELDVRLGAIYALERIAQDSPKDYWPTMEVLTAYVREHAPWRPDKTPRAVQKYVLADSQTRDHNFGERYCFELASIGADSNAAATPKALPTDIQAVLTILGRRRIYNEKEWQRLDLNHTDLRSANLRGARLDNAIFEGSNLQNVDGRNCFLNNADLSDTILIDVTFSGASLQGSIFVNAFANEINFYQAKLDRAEFCGTCLKKAQFGEASLRNARFESGAYLVEALFWDANLDGTSFEFANVKGANFERSSIRGADLRGTINLTVEQIRTAIKDKSTKLP